MVDYNKMVEATRLGQQAPQDKNIEALAGGYQAGREGAVKEQQSTLESRQANIKQILTNYTPYKEDGSELSFEEMNSTINTILQGGTPGGLLLEPKKMGMQTFRLDDKGNLTYLGENIKVIQDKAKKGGAGSSKEDPVYKGMLKERDAKNKELINVSKGIISGDEGVIKAEVDNLNNLVQDYMKRKYPNEYRPEEFERKPTGLFGWGKGKVVPRNEVERTTEDGRVAIFNAKTKKFIRYK